MGAPVKTSVTSNRQRYVDDPIYARPKPRSVIEISLAQAFDRKLPTPIVIAHERVRLRWMTPDGKGGLKPRERK